VASETLFRGKDGEEDYHHWVGRKKKELTRLYTGTGAGKQEQEQEQEQAEEGEEEAVPVAHGMYFAGGLLEPPQPPPKQHTRKAFLHVHLGDSDTESSNSSSGDSASSDEEVNRRQPYYQVYKLEKREKRLEREQNMRIRRKNEEKDETTFRIPPSLVLDPRGRPKSTTSFTAPAVSPPRNPRVTLGLHQSPTKRKINRVSRMRDGSAAAPTAAAAAGGAGGGGGGRRRRPYSQQAFNGAMEMAGGALHIPLDVDYSLSSDSSADEKETRVAEGRRDQRRHLGLAHTIALLDEDEEREQEQEQEEEQTVRAVSAGSFGSPYHPTLRAHTRSEILRSSPLNK
jgi:hypothetical protein